MGSYQCFWEAEDQESRNKRRELFCARENKMEARVTSLHIHEVSSLTKGQAHSTWQRKAEQDQEWLLSSTKCLGPQSTVKRQLRPRRQVPISKVQGKCLSLHKVPDPRWVGDTTKLLTNLFIVVWSQVTHWVIAELPWWQAATAWGCAELEGRTVCKTCCYA